MRRPMKHPAREQASYRMQPWRVPSSSGWRGERKGRQASFSRRSPCKVFVRAKLLDGNKRLEDFQTGVAFNDPEIKFVFQLLMLLRAVHHGALADGAQHFQVGCDNSALSCDGGFVEHF